jgi:hypothetical protein
MVMTITISMLLFALGCAIVSKTPSSSEYSGNQALILTGTMEEISWNPEGPNPFCPDNWIAFHLDNQQNVSIQHLDQNKVFVSDLFKGTLEAGNYKVTVLPEEGTKAGGIYYLKITVGEETQTRKLVLLV